MVEFNLSEKIVDIPMYVKNSAMLKVKDVKKFIKVVEDDYKEAWDKATDENKVIDKNKLKEILIKRAGDKLI